MSENNTHSTHNTLTPAPSNDKITLIRDALQQLENLDTAGVVTVTDAMRKTLVYFLNELVQDNQPYPQVEPSSSGGIEVVWLVGGNHLTLIIQNDGEWLIWGEDANGHEYLDEEKQTNQNHPSTEAITTAREWLTKMGHLTEHTPSNNPATSAPTPPVVDADFAVQPKRGGKTLEEFIAERPINEEQVEAHKRRMLAEIDEYSRTHSQTSTSAPSDAELGGETLTSSETINEAQATEPFTHSTGNARRKTGEA